MSITAEKIKITAQALLDSNECTFTVDRPIYPEGSLRCTNRDQAEGSPLLEELFEIAGVASVSVAGNDIVLTKNISDPWPELGEEVGAVIRDVLGSGEPLFADDAAERLAETDPDLGSPRAQEVQKLIDYEINPGVAAHGGYVQLLDVREDNVYIRMGGGCQGCGMAAATLKQGIEASIKHKLPWVQAVIDTTDHASGMNPYYQR